jgi:MFS family permease
MNAEVDGPVEVTLSRRRGSTVGSTGLDYSSCHYVDGDIICRIQSLLLARNDHYPPRTPCPSDEHNHLCSEFEAPNAFDFSTAKSVAKLARQETGRLSTPDIGKVTAKLAEMEARKTPRPSLPIIKLPSLRNSSSADDLRVHVDDTIQSPTTPNIDPDFPGKKPRFKLPKLVLQDKKKRNRKVKSCIEINPLIPEDDAKIHETELLCCPPCDPEDVPKSKYTTNYPRWPGGTVRAVPGDLACFLAGCPPSHLECKKHHRRQDRQDPQNSITDRRLAEDFKGVAEGLVQDIARLGHSLKDVKVWSATIAKEPFDTRQVLQARVEGQADRFGSDGMKGAPAISVKPPTSTSDEVSEPEICSSVTSTSDAFPHAFQSMELVANERVPHRFSTSVNTNFSLPGYKARRDSQVNPRPSKQESRKPAPKIDTSSATKPSITFESPDRAPTVTVSPKATVREKQSETPLTSKSKPPSLLSGGSRRSASARHALLKPSITKAQPVDTGLPIPPVLSPIASISEQTMPAMPAYDETLKFVSATDFGKVQKTTDLGSSVDVARSPPPTGTGPEASKPWGVTLGDVQAATASRVVGHVTSVQNAEDLQTVRIRVEETQPQQPVPARPQSPPPSIVKAKAAVGAPQIVAESSQSPPPGRNPASATQELAAVSQSDSLNAAYWGFVPTVKDAVKDAVQVAVRNAVQEIAVPPGIEKDQTSAVYRRLVASSLVEAAKTADDYLRRASLWNEPPSEIRGSESTVIRAPGELIYDSIVGDPAASVTSKENVETYGNRVPNPVLSVDEMDSVPLDTDDKPKPKKKRTRPFKNGLRFGYDVIPTRDSSKNRVLSTKTSGTNISSNIPRKRSFERIVNRVNLRSVSSEASLKQDKAGEKPLLTTRDRDRRNDRSSTSMEITGRQNTVHWLKGLLSSNGPYEPRFTALPPRSEQRHTRSQTAPVKPVEELYLESTPKLTNEGQRSAVKRDERADPSETFTRTINDLENLMDEALIIARQAADNQDAGYAPAVLGNAAKVLKTGRDRYQAKLSGIRDSEGSTARSIHESLRSYSDSDMSYHSDDQELYVQPPKEPDKGLTISLQNPPLKKSSGWPLTGRVSTPYPPASTIPSKDSPSSPPEAVDYLTSADPRSLPTETELQRPRKASNPVEFSTNLNVVYYDDADDPRPEFRNLEPFSSPISREATRKSSARSPKRLSPTRQTQNGPRPDLGDYQDIPLPKLTPRNTAPSRRCVQDAHSEEEHQAVKTKLASKAVPNKQEVRDYIVETRTVPIQPRTSSQNLRKQAEKAQGRNLLSPQTGQTTATGKTYDWQNIDMDKMPLVQEDNDADLPEEQGQQPAATDQPDCAQSFDGTQATEELDFDVGFGVRQRGGGEPSRSGGGVELQDNPDPTLPKTSKPRKRPAFSLRGKNHVSLNEHHKGFSLARSHKRQSIARDWSPGRKRFVASVACFSTALIGIIVGIYAGETPAIQYYIVDFHHYTVLGNVFFFIGLAIPTFFFWPLPLLHGRKPYILGSMSLAMPLLFPQALAVGSFRSPYVSTYRVGLILSRAVMGFSLGFANMNFKGMLTDLFGASLQSTNPHQEHVDEFDVRRHGGGMGVWLGLWTWSALGSIGLGFLIGAAIVNHLPPAWGFYVSICIIAFVMLLNVLCPEVRRSAFRRSVAEVVNGQEVSRRLARGEVKMHMVQSGPKWWGEEFHYGVMLSLKMLRQPGFMVMAVYVAWIYGQMVLNILVCAPFTYT